jgi:hypothetical protein
MVLVWAAFVLEKGRRDSDWLLFCIVVRWTVEEVCCVYSVAMRAADGQRDAQVMSGLAEDMFAGILLHQGCVVDSRAVCGFFKC